jgi:hypothetical protein
MAACDSLLKELHMIADPYLIYELSRINHVFENKYKYNKTRVQGAVFSIDKLPGIFDSPAILMAANTKSLPR